MVELVASGPHPAREAIQSARERSWIYGGFFNILQIIKISVKNIKKAPRVGPRPFADRTGVWRASRAADVGLMFLQSEPLIIVSGVSVDEQKSSSSSRVHELPAWANLLAVLYVEA